MRGIFLKQILMVLMMVMLVGCGSSREPIKSAVSSALTGIQNYDEVTVEKYFGVNLLDPDTFLDKKITNDFPFKRMMPQLVERFNFRILEVETDGDTAVVHTEMTNVDMEKVIPLFLFQILNESFTHATLSETGHANQVALEEAYQKIMTYIVHSQETELVSHEVAIHLVYEEDSWKIVWDEALLNGVYGGLVSYFNEDV